PPRVRRPDADRDADPAHAAHVAGWRARHEHDGDGAGGSAADPNVRAELGRGDGPRGDPARDRPGRADLLRPQPRADDLPAGPALEGTRSRGDLPGRTR